MMSMQTKILLGGFMKRIVMILVLLLLVGCGSNEDKGIKVYSRDESSGTRGAFHDIIGIETLTNETAIASSNGDMATQVGQNLQGIGYVSLSTDFDKNNIKPLTYEGVEASVSSVNDGTYALARPFVYVTRAKGDFESEDKEAMVAAFLDYLNNSKEGRQVVLAAGGIVDVDSAIAWSELKAKHPIVAQDNSSMTLITAGSTSVDKTLKAALESFKPLAGNVNFEMNHKGSGDGHKRTLGSEKDSANAADIGFASRDFKSDGTEDLSKAMVSGVYAKDAVVVVVHKNNKTLSISKDLLKKIYEGTITSWREVK